VVSPFGEQQQQAGLEEVARFQVGHCGDRLTV
jgi:hypothetical protein